MIKTAAFKFISGFCLMNFIKQFLFSALITPFLAGAVIHAAEFEVLDRFSVDGYSVLKGSADITGGSFTVGGSTFVVKNGNIGIGTTSPNGLLTLKSSGVGTAGGIRLISSDDANVAATISESPVTAGSGYIALTKNDVSQSAIILNGGGDSWFNTGGNVGIGTTAPGVNLQVVGGLAAGTINGSMGPYSAVIGSLNSAAGSYSLASGNGSNAGSDYSVALGRGAVVSGATYGAWAIGNTVTASADQALGLGSFVVASAANSMVIGRGIDASNKITNSNINSLAIGFNSTIPTLYVGPSAGANTTGNVGIGTTAPASPLDVNGNITISSGSPSLVLYAGDPANYRLYRAGTGVGLAGNGGLALESLSGNIGFYTAGAARMHVLNNGRVGVNNAAPDQEFTVGGDISQSGIIISSGAGNNYFAGNVGIGTTNPFYGKLHINVAADQNFIFRSGGVVPTARIETTNDAVNANVPMEFVATKYSFLIGNVGIGATAPGAPLNVFSANGSGKRTALMLTNPFGYGIGVGTGSVAIDFQRRADLAAQGSIEVGNSDETTSDSQYMAFSTWGTSLVERMRINGSGNVGIGTTNPGAKLSVVGLTGSGHTVCIDDNGNFYRSTAACP